MAYRRKPKVIDYTVVLVACVSHLKKSQGTIPSTKERWGGKQYWVKRVESRCISVITKFLTLGGVSKESAGRKSSCRTTHSPYNSHLVLWFYRYYMGGGDRSPIKPSDNINIKVLMRVLLFLLSSIRTLYLPFVTYITTHMAPTTIIIPLNE